MGLYEKSGIMKRSCSNTETGPVRREHGHPVYALPGKYKAAPAWQVLLSVPFGT